MPEPKTETTQVPPVVTTPPSTEQGTVGATVPAPSKKEGEQTTTPVTQVPPVTTAPTKLPPEEVQKRIDRMYARLQEERKQRLEVEARLHASGTSPRRVDEDDEEEGGGDTKVRTLTEADVEAVVERKERDKRFISSETRVFEQHPDALNEDGSFNMDSPFVQKYIEVGKKNPLLAAMENGPEMAAAMVDKTLGTDFKKGRTAEANRVAGQPANTFTTSSTTIIPPNATEVQLNDVQKRIAKRMGMSEKEYVENQTSNQVKQKSWEVKR